MPGGLAGVAPLSHALYYLQDRESLWTVLNQLHLHFFFAGENHQSPVWPLDVEKNHLDVLLPICPTSSLSPGTIAIPTANLDGSRSVSDDPSPQPQNKGSESGSTLLGSSGLKQLGPTVNRVS